MKVNKSRHIQDWSNVEAHPSSVNNPALATSNEGNLSHRELGSRTQGSVARISDDQHLQTAPPTWAYHDNYQPSSPFPHQNHSQKQLGSQYPAIDHPIASAYPSNNVSSQDIVLNASPNYWNTSYAPSTCNTTVPLTSPVDEPAITSGLLNSLPSSSYNYFENTNDDPSGCANSTWPGSFDYTVPQPPSFYYQEPIVPSQEYSEVQRLQTVDEFGNPVYSIVSPIETSLPSSHHELHQTANYDASPWETLITLPQDSPSSLQTPSIQVVTPGPSDLRPVDPVTPVVKVKRRRRRKPPPPPDVAAAKRQAFLLRNREAASKCCVKKKHQINDLETEDRISRQLNKVLKHELKGLLDDVANLRQQGEALGCDEDCAGCGEHAPMRKGSDVSLWEQEVRKMASLWITSPDTLEEEEQQEEEWHGKREEEDNDNDDDDDGQTLGDDDNIHEGFAAGSYA